MKAGRWLGGTPGPLSVLPVPSQPSALDKRTRALYRPRMSTAALASRINAHPDAVAACGSYWFVFTYVSPASLVGREVLT